MIHPRDRDSRGTAAPMILAVLMLFWIGCGGPAPAGPDPGTGSGPGPQTSVVTITAQGVSPKSLTVTSGTQVTFINSDAVIHLIYSDPHPEHTDCPEINQVGALDSGNSRQTGNLNTVRTCGYHDHNQPLNASLKGAILIH